MDHQREQQQARGSQRGVVRRSRLRLPIVNRHHTVSRDRCQCTQCCHCIRFDSLYCAVPSIPTGLIATGTLLYFLSYRKTSASNIKLGCDRFRYGPFDADDVGARSARDMVRDMADARGKP
jgi:hypothetical protein